MDSPTLLHRRDLQCLPLILAVVITLSTPFSHAVDDPITASDRALNNAPAEDTQDTGEVPVRERARDMVQSDQEFLERVEGVEDEAPRPSSSSPVPALVAPPAPTVEREPDPEPRPRTSPPPRPKVAPVDPEPEPRGERPAPRRTAPPPPEVDSKPERASAARISEAEARRFVTSYLEAAERPTPDREVSFYADRVNYFGQNKVDRSFIARDQRSYYKRWPSRNFSLEGTPQLVRASGDYATVRFRTRYSLSGGGKKASGEVDNVVRLKSTDDGLKIVAIAERKVP